ncbi:hypothetical protein HYG81_05345 [Natrinema zhouii]|uniref:Uncharacterized protein n=1 Tax=Natrinema zhouii TaxID=1710539 RepID=A0A7D6CQ51_9EURY|nr:hypothetical protein [Natrinema zhouii]QLK27035.1 hypothetical protein HYG81_05345 [Natrinema zhouii]
MTADERPTAPPELNRMERDALRELADRDAATLRAVSAYLEELAAWKTQQGDSEKGGTSGDDSDTYPDGVPADASVSVTEIDGAEYYYYQWRDGDEIRSETVQR